MTIYKHIAGLPTETKIPIVNDLGNYTIVDRKIRSFMTAIQEGGSAHVPSGQIFYNQAIIDGIVKSSKLG